MSNSPKLLYVNTRKPTSMLNTTFEKDNLYKAYEINQESLEAYVKASEVLKYILEGNLSELKTLLKNEKG